MTTVFWSWQSDLDARVTRDLVRDALAEAIKDLQAELDERPELTSDTKGVAGSPDIVATILAKIDAAAVFVADVTPIAMSNSGKAVANPNVLIELGYAKKSLGLNRIILVWNTTFPGTTPEDLPFDMRTRRAPISYRLAIEAPKEELRAERDKLKEILKEALRASIAVANPPPAVVPVEWQPTSDTPALWFDSSQPILINEGGESGTKVVNPGPYAYARIRPATWARPSDFGAGNHPPMFGDTRGFSWGTIKGGFLTYPGSLRASEQLPLVNMTMQFRTTGELWGVESRIVDTSAGFFYADYVIKSVNDFLEVAIPYLQRQGGDGPFQIRMGVTDLDGLRWISDTGWGGTPRALEPAVDATFSLASNDEAERLSALEFAWGEVAAAFGISEPRRETLVRQIRGF